MFNVRKHIILIILTLILLSPYINVKANPIPIPTVILEKENIEIVIRKISESKAHIIVKGTYPFVNVKYPEVTMYFPIPRGMDKSKITVLMDGKRIKWDVVEEGTDLKGRKIVYQTKLGKLPLLKWKITSPPKKFTITVKYEYYITAEEGVFRTVYALGTGRFGYYAKRCTANIKITVIGFKHSTLTLHLASPETREAETKVTFKIASDNEQIELVETSRMFGSLTRDLIIALTQGSSPSSTYKWVPSRPLTASMKVEYEAKTKTMKIHVAMTFKHGGFKVEWGDPLMTDGVIELRTKVLEYTGPSIQVLTRKTHMYEVKAEPGQYEIRLYVNNILFNATKVTIKVQKLTGKIVELVEGNIVTIILIAIIIILIILLAVTRTRRF